MIHGGTSASIMLEMGCSFCFGCHHFCRQYCLCWCSPVAQEADTIVWLSAPLFEIPFDSILALVTALHPGGLALVAQSFHHHLDKREIIVGFLFFSSSSRLGMARRQGAPAINFRCQHSAREERQLFVRIIHYHGGADLTQHILVQVKVQQNVVRDEYFYHGVVFPELLLPFGWGLAFRSGSGCRRAGGG